MDYRCLNQITTKDAFPLPRIDDIYDQLIKATYFKKFDFKAGYFQVPLAKADRPKTTFSTRDGHFQFKRFICINIGFLVGILIMFLLAIFEDKLIDLGS